MDFGLRFAPAGGVTAQSLGVPPPDCGPKERPVLGADGSWTCGPQTTDGPGAAGGVVMLLLAAGLVYLMAQSYGKRVAKVHRAVSRGDVGGVLEGIL